jgi:hypothetical protein
MLETSENKLIQALCCGWLLAAVFCCEPVLSGEEQAEPKDCPHACQVRAEVRGGIQLLDKIPFVRRFFPIGIEEQKLGLEPTLAAERIGVDFEWMPGHVVAFYSDEECQNACAEKNVAICPADPSSTTTAVVCPKSHACSASVCKACDAQCGAVTKLSCLVAHECEGEQSSVEGYSIAGHAVCERITELVAEKAALESALEAHEALAEAKDEMFQMMVELSAENAKLGAQVELLTQRDELHEKLLMVATENSKLKAAAELGEEKQKLLMQSFEVALENERLKTRVAELEQRDLSQAKPASQRQASKKKARAR